ncbi:hypothetical protein [Oryza sativa Japonica Group]|uniref:Uncharacterized protein n=1 Tax=Oryza sativa subsp. japonica TaxID=39947 RepID=Q5N7G1_ORYSJ|nr:hypothetical protein [Oryza sativa Japonica Group]
MWDPCLFPLFLHAARTCGLHRRSQMWSDEGAAVPSSPRPATATPSSSRPATATAELRHRPPLDPLSRLSRAAAPSYASSVAPGRCREPPASRLLPPSVATQPRTAARLLASPHHRAQPPASPCRSTTTCGRRRQREGRRGEREKKNMSIG